MVLPMALESAGVLRGLRRHEGVSPRCGEIISYGRPETLVWGGDGQFFAATLGICQESEIIVRFQNTSRASEQTIPRRSATGPFNGGSGNQGKGRESGGGRKVT